MSVANDRIVTEEAIAELDAALDRARDALQAIIARGGDTTVARIAEEGLALLARARSSGERLFGIAGGVLNADRMQSVLDWFEEERRAEYEEAPTRPSLRVVAHE